MANPIPAAFLNFPIVDPKTGRPSIDFLRWLTQMMGQTRNLNLNGSLNGGSGGQIDPAVLAGQVANLDANGVVLPNGVDLSRAYVNKYLDYISDGPNYSRTLGAYVTSGVPYNFKGAWSSVTAYLKGAEVSYQSNYWLALLPSTNSAPAIGNSNWQLLGPVSLDNLGDGSTYSKTLASYVSSGVPYNYKGTWSSVTSYPKGAEVSYLNNYWLALANNTNSAPAAGNANWQLLGPTTLDNLADGPIYLRRQGDASNENIVQNGDFTNGTAFWNVNTTTVSESDPWGNTRTCGRSVSVFSFGFISPSPIWRVAPGDLYVFDFWYKTGGTGTWQLFNGPGVGGPSLGAPTVWTHFIFQWTVGSTNYQLQPQFVNTSATAGTIDLAAVTVRKVRDTPDVQNNAISQAASGSTGVVNGTVNVYMDGASSALAGGGTCATISFYFTLYNNSAVAQAMNWRVLRNSTVLISGSTVVTIGGTFQLLPANIIDVAPPSGTNTYKIQCDFTTGASAVTGFQSSNIAITNLSK
jgi:hypothetical protein